MPMSLDTLLDLIRGSFLAGWEAAMESNPVMTAPEAAAEAVRLAGEFAEASCTEAAP